MCFGWTKRMLEVTESPEKAAIDAFWASPPRAPREPVMVMDTIPDLSRVRELQRA